MVMKREVVGYTTMSEHLIDTQLTRSPFFFASANQSMLGCGVAHAFQQAIPFAELANKPNSFCSRPNVMSATIHYCLA